MRPRRGPRLCPMYAGRGLLTERPRAEAISGGRLYEEIEAVPFEDRLRCLRAQERQILGSIGLGSRRQRSRINDWIARIVGKNADNLHVRFHLSIGLIDNTERHLAARDQTEG